MEDLKEKLPTIIGVIIVIALVGLLFYNYGVRSLTLYTKIDNTKISNIESTDNMKYEYELVSYDANGKSRKVKFKTSRELKNKAYLKLKYYYISGVNKWEEVQYNELPSKVKNKLK